MSWLALCDFVTPLFSRRGLARALPDGRGEITDAAEDLPTGTFVVEALFQPSSDGRHRLLTYRRPGGEPVDFSVTVSASEGAIISHREGRETRQYRVSADIMRRGDPLRMTLNWDRAADWGLLSLENLETGHLKQAEVSAPLPVRLVDIERMSLRTRKPDGNAVSYFGFSGGIEPVGLSACIAPHAPVETPQGPKMIDRLKPGDLILTRDNGPQPVRWVGAREVPARGGFRPIRLRAPYFGLTRDLQVAPDQCLLITGSEVEYLFGEEEVLVEARHLVNGVSAYWEKTGPTVQLYHILLDQHEVIRIAGCELESLYVGSIASDAALLGTTMLREIAPETVPSHSGSARPILKSYEAMTLQTALAS